MKLRFPVSKIPVLAAQYEANLSDRDRRLTSVITQSVFPSYELKGFLTKDEFLSVCEWKTPRSKSRCNSNDADLIKDISSVVRVTESERLRIQAWTLLSGVRWPTASVFLHFAFPDCYPILDFRALWSVGSNVSPYQYTFDVWWEYTEFCRTIARNARATMRQLDQALWQYSKKHQKLRA